MATENGALIMPAVAHHVAISSRKTTVLPKGAQSLINFGQSRYNSADTIAISGACFID